MITSLCVVVFQSDSEPDTPTLPSVAAAKAANPASPPDGASATGHKHNFLQIVQRSSEAVQRGDFHEALRLYTEGLAIDPSNHILFSNRSAAYIKQGQYKKALQDARRARDLNPNWAKVSYVDLLYSNGASPATLTLTGPRSATYIYLILMVQHPDLSPSWAKVSYVYLPYFNGASPTTLALTGPRSATYIYLILMVLRPRP